MFGAESKLFVSATAARDTVRRIVFEEVRELLGGMASAEEELRALGDESAERRRRGHLPRERHHLVPSGAGHKSARLPSDSGSSAASDSASSSTSPSLSDSHGSQKGGAPGQKLPDRLASLVIHKVLLRASSDMSSILD